MMKPVHTNAPGLIDKKEATRHGWIMFAIGAGWILAMIPAALIGLKYIIHDVAWLYNWLIG
jgi:hypothetical protein